MTAQPPAKSPAKPPALPPGPRLAPLTSLRYIRDPYTLFRECRARYGDPFTVFTNARTVMTGHAEGVRQIFTAHPDTFKVELPAAQKRVLGEKGLVAHSGAAHKRERRMIAPHFQGDPMKALGGMMKETAEQAMAAWTPGEALVVRKAALAIALDVILKAVVGAEDRAGELDRFRDAVLAFARAFGNPLFLTMSLFGASSTALPPNRRFHEARARLAELVAELAGRRRADPGGAERPDILSRLVHARYPDGTPMGDEALQDNMIVNLVAGHETSVLGLTWAMHWAHAEPGVLERLVAEIDTLGPDPAPDAYAALPYLDAFVKECLRLYPAVPDIVRQLAEPLELRGWTVPAGVNVSACAAVLHYDPELYPEPDAFRPDRFLGRRPSPFEYIPFGGGERICLGQFFSVYEIKIVLGVLLGRCRFRRADTGPLVVARTGFLMGPKTGVRLVYVGPRQPPSASTSVTAPAQEMSA